MAASQPSESKNTISRFFLARTVQDARKTLETKIQGYTTAVDTKLAPGRTFAKELRNDPVETLDGLLADSKKAARRLSRSSRKRVQALVDDTRSLVKKTADQPMKTLETAVKSVKQDARNTLEKLDAARETIAAARKKAVQGLDQDARLVLDDMAERVRKYRDRASIPSLFNLPSRKEIDALLRGLEGINTRVETLAGTRTR